jgi:hypothetical protein
MNEIWKDVSGYEGLYQVSNLGNVKSLDRMEKLKNGAIRKRQGRYLSLKVDKYGYLIAVLTKNARHKDFKVHRLVAAAFIGNPNDYDQVNHKDENKKNNVVTNLEWCNAKYNTNYGTRNQRLTGRLYTAETRKKISDKVKQAYARKKNGIQE